MKRIVLALIALSLLAAVVTTVAEASGLGRRCGCEPDCWCKKPGLSLFRWVTPKRKHHLLSADDKRALAEANS